MKLNALLLSAAVGFSTVQAAQIDPTFDSFGPLPGATFGGSGIPNHAVAIAGPAGDHSVVVGLTAHQRYSNPVVVNNGNGTFYAPAGEDSTDAGYAKWNIGLYVDFGVPITLADGYSVNLFYDKDPAVNNDVTTVLSGPAGDGQNSWNLGMAFLTGAPAFDPNASGEYDFMLQILRNGDPVATSAISVVVANVPEGGASLALLGLGALALGGLNMRRKAA